MSREIKFRAWDNNFDKMIYNDQFSIGFDGSVFYGNADMTGYPLKLMQHTGLYDKEGTPIYEGDIVKYPHIVAANPIWEVAYHKGSYVIKQKYLRITIRELANKDNLEVIGNCFEHPHLLKGEPDGDLSVKVD